MVSLCLFSRAQSLHLKRANILRARTKISVVLNARYVPALFVEIEKDCIQNVPSEPDKSGLQRGVETYCTKIKRSRIYWLSEGLDKLRGIINLHRAVTYYRSVLVQADLPNERKETTEGFVRRKKVRPAFDPEFFSLDLLSLN